MSRGYGSAQRAIISAFRDQPGNRFTVMELCELAYPNQLITDSHKDTIRRALHKVEEEIGLVKCRAGSAGKGGWKYVIGSRGGVK